MKEKLILSVCLLSALLAPGVFGQNSGALSGKVTAAGGAPVPNASIVITNSSGMSRSAVAGSDGAFSVTNLPPGTYRVEVQVPGFKRLTQDNVQVSSGTPVNLTLGLEQGNQSDTVEVQGQAPLTQDENAEMGHSYTGRVISELPVQDLNHQQLVELMPGVTPPAVSGSILTNPQRNRAWNTNGQAAQANDTRLDGVENVQAFNGGSAAVHEPAINAIQQMNLSTSNYDASQGRAAGSVLSPLTKSGTNALHGDLFEYNSNDWFRARNYFDPSPFAQPRFTSNQFGGYAGGAFAPDRTFWFLSYQGDFLRDATPTFATVPNAAFASGDFSALPNATVVSPTTGIAFPNNRIPASLINPAARAILSALPAPNLTGAENNYFTNVPFSNDGNRVDARIDQHFSDRTAMFLRYGLSYYNTTEQSALGAIGGTGGTSRLRAHDALIAATHSFGPNTFTDLRLSYTRYSDPVYGLSNVSGSPYGFTGASGALPYIQIDGMQPIGTNPSYPQINKEDTYNLVNSWHARVFNQDIRFGVDIWQIRADGFQNMLYGPAGGYTFSPGATAVPGGSYGFANSIASFLLGAPTLSGITTSSYVPSYVSWQYGGYIADRLNLGSKLTLDLGVRYDYFRPIEPRNNAALYSVFNPAANMLSPLGTNGVDRYGNVKANNLNFAPRIGLAYRFNDRTVIRAGYGMSYWNPAMVFGASSLIPAMNAVQNGVAGSYTSVGSFGALPAVSGSAAAPNLAYYYSPNQVRTPYVQFYNFDIQRDLTHGVLFDVSYAGNLGRELPYTQNVNAALPGAGTAGEPLAALGRTAPTYLRGTGYNSNYSALQLNLTKRFSQGLAFTVAYTWSKSLDYGAGLTPFLNNIDPRANYGPSNFDRTHVLTLTHNWRIPIGAGTQYLNRGFLGKILGPWELDGILRYGSGLPFTPTASAAACACPGNTATANVVPGPTYTGVNYYPSYFGYFYYAVPYLFSTYSFGQPSPGSFGNIGRNSVRGDDFTNYDLALSRSFVFLEQSRLEFRAEAYNIANSVHFGAPITNVNSSGFGESLNTAPGLDSRTLQLALKLVF